MKILLVHNDYAKYSGEEAVVDKMTALFSSLGNEVAQFRMSTEGLRDNLSGKAKGFISGVYSPSGVKAMAKALDREKPDIVNVHNLYPFITPASLRECKKRGIPVIMTVHNYRLICPTGLFLRDNAPCEYCLKKGNEWGCVKFNCEGSLLKSLGYASRNAVARIKNHFIDCVDYFACLTDFQRQKLIEAGFPSQKLVVIPNSINPSSLSLSSLGENEKGYIAYSGRLSPEKGIDLILEVARRHPEIPFKLAGALNIDINKESIGSNVEILGHLSGKKFEEFNRNAAFFVMASRCYEGFPMSILEAGTFGKAVIAPKHGGFPEIINENKSTGSGVSGLLFTPGDVDSLEQAVLKLWNNPELRNQLGRNAFIKSTKDYSLSTVSSLWQSLIERVSGEKL